MASGSETLNGWNGVIESLPGAHVLQSWQWGQFKAMYGWRPLPQVWRDAGGKVLAAAMVLERTIRLTPFGPRLNILYVPRGPLLDWEDSNHRTLVLDGLQALAKKEKAIFIKIDPEVLLGSGIPGSSGEISNPYGKLITGELESRNWLFSQDQIQFRNTVWLDLNGTEEDWLARMKPKTRYNIRLAEKKGVTVRKGTADDLSAVYQMYAETSVRDGFVIRAETYYLRAWKYFMEAGLAEVLLAEVEGELVAGLILFFTGQRAWYMYGMSRELHRDKMPNYLLQWQAMCTAQTRGCLQYDLWGAPDSFDETDSMWGVFRFKEGLGGQVSRFIGAWDFTPRPLLYRIYTNMLPRLLNLIRRRGKE
ncbi:peptidoglycan bridge formation glycyltransferase FemA/FemB family protein, partial [bacterium]|nr:peptidoglycan bridge formation glycyltransferase FemA/FemB family protein [bacterium]